MNSTEEKDRAVMTRGSVTAALIKFSLPILAGNLFQQLYNIVDAWVVGNYVGRGAFSAVGTVSPITNTFLGFFIGLSAGFEVVTAQYRGAEDRERVSAAAHTAVAVTFLLGMLMSAIGLASSGTLLRLMKVPGSVMPSARTYLLIYCAGLWCLVLYNAGAGILRAVGDSLRPVAILLISTALNIGLDLLLVLRFGMGVEGVALATVISQLFSACAVLGIMLTGRCPVHLSLRALRIRRDILIKALRIGIPTSLQLVLMSLSNIFAQSYINHFGEVAMSGWTAYSKIDQLVFLPMQTVSMAVTTFVGQNLGAGDTPRARQGVRKGFFLVAIISVVLITPVMLLAPSLVAVFNSSPEVIRYGTVMLRWISPFYFFNGMAQVYLGALRGAGNSRMPTILMLTSLVVVRQVYMFVTANFISNTLVPIIMGYPVCFLTCALSVYAYYRRCGLEKYRVV